LADLRRPDGRAVFAVLNHLVHAGLLSRVSEQNGYSYEMTIDATVHYYYGLSQYNDNRGNLQYLCYSHVGPDGVC